MQLASAFSSFLLFDCARLWMGWGGLLRILLVMSYLEHVNHAPVSEAVNSIEAAIAAARPESSIFYFDFLRICEL